MDDIDPSAPSLNLGKLIKEQVAESMKNVDVLSLLQKMVASSPQDEESEDIRQKLKGILAQYNELAEQDKVQFVNQIKEALANKLAMKLKDTPMDFSGVEDAIKDAVMPQLYMLGAAIFAFVVLLVFFGYKLYKSIKEKEKKREEKKKLKQMKKKK